METRCTLARSDGWWIVLFIVLTLPSLTVRGEDADAAIDARLPVPEVDKSVLKPPRVQVDQLPEGWEEHPLARALQFAVQHHEYIREHVQTFACVLAKRERINGRLREYEYLRTLMRNEKKQDGEVVEPLAVFTEYLSPAKVRGRKVLFVEGQNDNKMMVRRGGPRFAHVVMNIAPDSEAAQRESRYPIMDLSLAHVVERLIEQAYHDIRVDPEGLNTEVSFFRGATIDGRRCTHIKVTHPEEDYIFAYHMASIYVDDELHVPLRVETYTWPKKPDEKAILVEEYTYMRLKLNVQFPAGAFSETKLREAN